MPRPHVNKTLQLMDQHAKFAAREAKKAERKIKGTTDAEYRRINRAAAQARRDEAAAKSWAAYQRRIQDDLIDTGKF
jgi:hypothetical protein